MWVPAANSRERNVTSVHCHVRPRYVRLTSSITSWGNILGISVPKQNHILIAGIVHLSDFCSLLPLVSTIEWCVHLTQIRSQSALGCINVTTDDKRRERRVNENSWNVDFENIPPGFGPSSEVAEMLCELQSSQSPRHPSQSPNHQLQLSRRADDNLGNHDFEYDDNTCTVC